MDWHSLRLAGKVIPKIFYELKLFGWA